MIGRDNQPKMLSGDRSRHSKEGVYASCGAIIDIHRLLMNTSLSLTLPWGPLDKEKPTLPNPGAVNIVPIGKES